MMKNFHYCKFNVNTYAELLIKKQPNIIPGVPTLFEALLQGDPKSRGG